MIHGRLRPMVKQQWLRLHTKIIKQARSNKQAKNLQNLDQIGVMVMSSQSLFVTIQPQASKISFHRAPLKNFLAWRQGGDIMPRGANFKLSSISQLDQNPPPVLAAIQHLSLFLRLFCLQVHQRSLPQDKLKGHPQPLQFTQTISAFCSTTT